MAPKHGKAEASVLETDRWEYDKTYLFRLRRIKSGNFAGLWELCKMSPTGQVEQTISDADNLNFCIENMQGELENDGF